MVSDSWSARAASPERHRASTRQGVPESFVQGPKMGLVKTFAWHWTSAASTNIFRPPNPDVVSGSGAPGFVKGMCASVCQLKRCVLAHTHPYTFSTDFSLCYGFDNTSVLRITLQPQHCPHYLYKATVSEEAPLQRECPGVEVPG